MLKGYQSLLALSLLVLTTPVCAGERIVYPQAAVGPIGDQWFEIQLKIGNRSPNFPWDGTVRLLQKTSLGGMSSLDINGPEGALSATEGAWNVTLPASGSATFTISSQDLQVGILTIEGASGSPLSRLTPSFFYRLRKQQGGTVTDLIAIQPVREPGLSFDTMISRDATLNVGLALVSDEAIDAAGGEVPETEVTVTVVLDSGEEIQGLVQLGGAEDAQKAVFPNELLDSLPESIDAARLRLAASDPIYVSLLAVGTPPLFDDIQIGAAPAEVATSGKFRLRDGWEFVPTGEDILTGNSWACAGPYLTEFPGGLISSAPNGFQTRTNLWGTSFEVSGDFGLFTSLRTGESAYLVAFGHLSDGPEWWRGLRRIDFGIRDGKVVADEYNNSPTKVVHTFFDSETFQGETTLELARVGGTFSVYANDRFGGSFPDFGLIDNGRLWVGANVEPQSSLTMFSAGAERRQSNPEAVTAVPPIARQEIPPQIPSLRTEASGHGVLVGAAVRLNPFVSEDVYRQTLAGVFNELVAENAMKWDSIHPERHRYNFCGGDSLVAFAETNGMSVRGHTLLWHNQLPQWLTGGAFSRNELIGILRDHVFRVAGHYRGKIKEWDVLNEAFETDGSLRHTLFLDTIGPEYIDMVFRWTHEADPEALLVYNDYGAEVINPKSTAILEYIKGMLERGVPIDGIGFQGHIGLLTNGRPSKGELLENFARFRDLGLNISLTEIDVILPVENGQATAGNLQYQAGVFRDLLEACLESGSCSSFVTWGFTDKHSWIPELFDGYGAALLFGEDYNPKPAYEALLDVLSN